jgi:hypothetical protein
MNKKFILNYVEKVIKRCYRCNEVDFYIITDLWVKLNEDNISKYDNYNPMIQVKKMWSDIKKVYDKIKNYGTL